MKYEIRRVGVWSVAKISFVLGAVFGFLIGGFFWMLSAMLASLPLADLGEPMQEMEALGAAGIVFPFLMAVFYGVASMIGNAILAAIYNLLARLVGGFELTLAPAPAAPPVPPAGYGAPAGPPASTPGHVPPPGGPGPPPGPGGASPS